MQSNFILQIYYNTMCESEFPAITGEVGGPAGRPVGCTATGRGCRHVSS